MARCKENIFIILVCYVYAFEFVSDESGHMQPFGQHTVPREVDAIDEFPTPRNFYEMYQRPGKPVLFKSVLNKAEFPPFRLWTDAYLRKNFGHLVFNVETGKKENRSEGLLKKKFEDFLDDYKKEDIYLVSDITESMFGDMHIPRSMQCGGLQHVIDTIVIRMSSGGTKSVLHIDNLHNVNCLLEGTQTLILVDRKYRYLMEADGFMTDGSRSSMDVDMEKFPWIKDVPTSSVSMEAGDCLYIPYRWYRQVNSFGKRNIAINCLSLRVPSFNYSDCEDVDLTQQTVPFIKYGFIKKSLKRKIVLFDQLLDVLNLQKEDLFKMFVEDEAKDKHDILEYVDRNGDSVVTWDELLKVDVRDIFHKFRKSLKIPPNFLEDLEKSTHNHKDNTQIQSSREEL